VDAAGLRAAPVRTASGKLDALAGRYLHAELTPEPSTGSTRSSSRISARSDSAAELKDNEGERIALDQPVVGDLAGNRADPRPARRGEGQSADLVLFPELAVTGYPPEDLLLRPGFVRAAKESLEEIARSARGIVAVVGTPHFDRDLFNAAAVCAGGEVKALVRKRFLPNYGVFDEFRYFAPGDGLYLFEHGDTLIGVTICEDMWQPGPPATDLALAGAELIVNISASPFHLLRDREREEMFRTRARDCSAYVAFCNTVGGQDELIFDGHSLVIDDEGTVLARAPGFEEALVLIDVDPSTVVTRRLTDTRRRALAQDRGELGAVETIHVGVPHEQKDVVTPPLTPFLDDLEQMRLALELGLSDYMRKNGFKEIVVGVSGGIDSAPWRRSQRKCLDRRALRLMRRGSRRKGLEPMRGVSPKASAATSERSRSSRWSRPTARRSGNRSRAASPTSPRRTCRRGSGGRC
jgi:predicted amidohydrolase